MLNSPFSDSLNSSIAVRAKQQKPAKALAKQQRLGLMRLAWSTKGPVRAVYIYIYTLRFGCVT